MGLPSSRNTTYTGATPVKSADLNDIQDAIIAGRHHGTLKRNVDISSFAVSSGSATYDGTKITLGAITEIDVPITLNEGDTITAVTVYFNRDSGTTLTFALRERTPGSGPGTVVSKNISSGAANQNTDIGTSPSSGSLPKTLAAARTYFLRMSGTTGDDLLGLVVTYQHDAS